MDTYKDLDRERLIDRLEDILNLALKRAEQAEVFSVSSRTTPVRFEANELKRVETRESSTTALRIFRQGKIGFAVAVGLDLYSRNRDELEKLVDTAVETSQFGSVANFEFPSSQNRTAVDVFDPTVRETSLDKMVEMGKELILKIREHTPQLLCDVTVNKGTNLVALVNSQGVHATYQKSSFSLSVEGTLVRDTDLLFVGDSQSSCRVPAGVEELVSRVIRQLEMARRNASLSPGLWPVIFTPRGVAAALLTPLALGLSGRMATQGTSPLRDKLGQQIFDKQLSIWDDATIPYGIGSYPFDDEGIPGQCSTLVRDGTVCSFFYDLQTAALAGVQSTGNGRRIGSAVPRPAVSSLVINSGQVSFQQMVEDMKEGLIVEQVIGAEQGNVLNGDFGGNVLLGYKVEKGNVVGRVKNTMISGNVYELLREIEGIGRERVWVEGVLLTPALYLPRIAVTTKE